MSKINQFMEESPVFVIVAVLMSVFMVICIACFVSDRMRAKEKAHLFSECTGLGGQPEICLAALREEKECE